MYYLQTCIRTKWIFNFITCLCECINYFQLLYYVYSIVGMELFSGRINSYPKRNTTNETELCCGSPYLNLTTEFVIKGYCKNNFNGLLHSFVVLFDLMIVNQWHDILFILQYCLRLSLSVLFENTE